MRTSYLANSNNRGYRVYTNGITNLKIKPGDTIPDGFHPGSLTKGRTISNQHKGKTYQELYGEDKASELKAQRSKHLMNNNPSKRIKGLKYEEIYDLETVNRLKENRSMSGKKNVKEYQIFINENLSFIGARADASEFLHKKFGGSKANCLYDRDWLLTHNIKVDTRYKNR